MGIFTALRIGHKKKHTYDVNEIAIAVAPIAKKHRVKRMYLFGSYARGEADSYSDIDVLVESDEIVSYLQISDLQLDLEDALCKNVDVIPSGCKKSFIEKIKQDLVLIYAE